MPGRTITSVASTSGSNTKIMVVGLGNITHPGTRHSVGHHIVDALANHLGARMNMDRATNSWIGTASTTLRKRSPKNKKGRSEYLEGSETTIDIVLVKPKPLMNISGKAVGLAYKTYHRPAPLRNVIVIHDSLTHKPFTTSPRVGGSALGHNGVRSTIDALGSPEFSRIRVGIGRNSGDAATYVLESMSSGERTYWCSTDACEKIMADIETLLSESEQA